MNAHHEELVSGLAEIRSYVDGLLDQVLAITRSLAFVMEQLEVLKRAVAAEAAADEAIVQAIANLNTPPAAPSSPYSRTH